MIAEKLVNNGIKCECGREHINEIGDIVIGSNVLNKIPEILKKHNAINVLMVTDNNCYKVAGKTVEDILSLNSNIITTCILNSRNHIVPDEYTIGKILSYVNKSIDMIIGIGSGTINDLCKYVSDRCKIPYIIVATAPSMDGFASIGSALIIDNLKTSYEATFPKAIIADTTVIKNAPYEMILAGLGDMIGKYTALCDWELSRIINEEYYCPVVVSMVKKAIEESIDDIPGIKVRNEKSIENLIRNLITIGIAMGYVKNSRPASGAEHHLAHFFEMNYLQKGTFIYLHGTCVGIATVVILKLYELLLTTNIDFKGAATKIKGWNPDSRKSNIMEVFKEAGAAIIESNSLAIENYKEDSLELIERIEKNWNEIITTIKTIIPKSEVIINLLKEAGAPFHPSEINIDKNTLSDGIKMAREIRDRFTILQILNVLGILDDFADIVATSFFN